MADTVLMSIAVDVLAKGGHVLRGGGPPETGS